MTVVQDKRQQTSPPGVAAGASRPRNGVSQVDQQGRDRRERVFIRLSSEEKQRAEYWADERGFASFNEYIAETSRSFERGTPRLFRSLGRIGADVDVLAPVGQVPTAKKRCARGSSPYRCALPRARVLNKEKSRLSFARRSTRLLAGRPRLIDVNGAFCNARRCRGLVGGTATWYDDLHISATMARTRMARYFVRSVTEVRS